MELLNERNENIQLPKKKRKYHKDIPDAVKKRNDARKEKRQTIEGKINFSTNSEDERQSIYALCSDIKTAQFMSSGGK